MNLTVIVPAKSPQHSVLACMITIPIITFHMVINITVHAKSQQAHFALMCPRHMIIYQDNIAELFQF